MELPNELIDEILTRVPVKYVLRCRCVSKGWCSVIDSTKFVEKYLKVSIERNRGGLIIGGGGKFLLADLESFDDGSALIDISEEVKGVLNGAILLGSANGLVCLGMYSDDKNVICLLNPSTRKFKKLPVVGTKFLDDNNLNEYFLHGFGYDCVSDDYKVVLMGKRYFPRGIMAIVYSLKKNSWAPIPNVFSTENLGFFYDFEGTFVDGALLWNTLDVTSGNSVIVGFDLGLEQFREAIYYTRTVKLMDITIENSRADEISANPVYKNFWSPRPVTYSKTHDKILLEVDCRRFVWYDFRNKVFKNVTIPGIPKWFVSQRYIESLFPLSEDRQPATIT